MPATLGFFKGVLLPDPKAHPDATRRKLPRGADGEIHRSGADHRRHPDADRYTQAAIALEKTGAKVTFAKDDLPYPEELILALDENPDLALAFDALTPGRRRGYLLHFNQPKASATKSARISKHTARILQGKGMNDR